MLSKNAGGEFLSCSVTRHCLTVNHVLPFARLLFNLFWTIAVHLGTAALLRLKIRLDVIQHRMIRFIHGMHHLDHVDLRHNLNLSWLTMCDRVHYFKLCLVFKVKAGRAPSYLSDCFVPVSSSHTHQTRGSHAHNFTITRQISASSNSFLFTSIKAWNDLPAHLKLINSDLAFRKALKTHFLSKYT